MAVGGAVVAASPSPSFRPHAMVQLVARPTIRIMRGNVVFISRPRFGHSPRAFSRVSREHAVDLRVRLGWVGLGWRYRKDVLSPHTGTPARWQMAFICPGHKCGPGQRQTVARARPRKCIGPA